MDVVESGLADAAQVVGIRLGPGQPLLWRLAGQLPAVAGSWAVTEIAGTELVGQVIVGRGQCLAFPENTTELPVLLRAAPPPAQVVGAGQRLLASLD